MKEITHKIPPGLLESLTMVCNRRHIKRTEVINEAIRLWLQIEYQSNCEDSLDRGSFFFNSQINNPPEFQVLISFLEANQHPRVEGDDIYPHPEDPGD